MGKKNPEEAKTDSAANADDNPPKRGGFIGKIFTNKALILHFILVLALLGLFTWQVLNFYSLSKESNRGNAIKTNHMVVFDLISGDTLSALPHGSSHAEGEHAEEEHPADAAPAHADDAPAELIIIISNIGKNPALVEEISAMPADYIYSYSPYDANVLANSMKKYGDGAATMADIVSSESGKLDISPKNNGYRNAKNAEAAISKVYKPSAALIYADEAFTASEGFAKLAEDLEVRDMHIVLAQPYSGKRENVVVADVVIPANATTDSIKSSLAKLEIAAHSHGSAIAVIQPQAGISTILAEWSQKAKAAKFKFTTIIK